MRRRRPEFTHANVLSTRAVFGCSPGATPTRQIRDGAVTAAELADGVEGSIRGRRARPARPTLRATPVLRALGAVVTTS